MKKIFMVIALMAMLMLPFTSFSMTAMEESDLSSVTGQAGVSINLDANIHLEVGTAAWGDKDGLGTTEASGAGWIGVKGIDAFIRVRADQELLSSAFYAKDADGLGADAVGGYATDDHNNDGLIDPAVGSVYLLNFAGSTIGGIATQMADGKASLGSDMTTKGTALATTVGAYIAGGGSLPAGMSAGFDPATPAAWTSTDAYLLDQAGIIELNDYKSFMKTAGLYMAYDEFVAQYPGAIGYAEAFSEEFKPLTIDVATDAGEDHGVANTTFVRIGLGSLEIAVSSMNIPVALGGSTVPTDPPDDQIPNLNQTLGSVYMSGLMVRILGSSYVDIYNGRAGAQGVTLGLDVTVKSLKITQLSWGDADGFVGFGNTEEAGYVGLENLTIDGLTVKGKVDIDVATTGTTNDYEDGVAVTFVRLGLNDLEIGLGAVDATAVLGDKNDFSGTKYELGSIYMSATTITFATGTYLDIFNYSGKNGVVADFDLLLGDLTITTLSWGDSDGLPADYADAGYVGVKDLTIANLEVLGRVDINVATVEAGNTLDGPRLVGTTFVRIGMQGINVSLDSLNADVAMGSEKTLSETDEYQVLGSVYMSGLTTDVNGNVDIYAGHYAAIGDNQGVVIDMNATLSAVTLDAVSWGDDNLDLINGSTDPGYVGLRGLALGATTVVGKVSIDVATVDAYYTPIDSLNLLMYGSYETHQLSPTFVHIGLGTGNAENTPSTGAEQLLITVGSLAADIALDSVKALNVGTGALGSLYMSGVNVGINGWVDIAAH